MPHPLPRILSLWQYSKPSPPDLGWGDYTMHAATALEDHAPPPPPPPPILQDITMCLREEEEIVDPVAPNARKITPMQYKSDIDRMWPHPTPAACPVRAWTDYMKAFPALATAAAFVDHAGMPLTAGGIVPTVQVALLVLRHPAAGTFSLHSLRRSGSQTAALSGASRTQVIRHSHWRSAAIHTYVPRQFFRTGASIHVHLHQQMEILTCC